VARTRAGSFLTVQVEPCEGASGRIVYADPAAVLSAVHAHLADSPGLPAVVTCVLGEQRFQARLLPATDMARAT
jgi:hypothetical protein